MSESRAEKKRTRVLGRSGSSGAKAPGPAFEEVARAVTERLRAGERVRRSLPGEGRLNIDRQLPFLCLYRCPTDRADLGTAQLITGEAAYLTASLDPSLRSGFKRLTRSIVEALSQTFGAFLIVEVWAGTDVTQDSPPGFRLFEGHGEASQRVVDALESNLSKIVVLGRKAKVEVISRAVGNGNRPRSLLEVRETRELGCTWIGIEVAPIYREKVDGPLFPMVMRALRPKFGRALRQSFFAFTAHYTSHRTKNFLSLGRKTMVKAVWRADEQLARVASSFDFLITLNPTNAEPAWHAFRRSHFDKEPFFRYRPLPVDPSLLKRALYQIPIDKIEDPTVSNLFVEKQVELDRQLTMLTDRGSHRFLLGSQQLYGPCAPALVRQAEEILERVSSKARGPSSGGSVTDEEFQAQAEVELAEYRAIWDGFKATARVSDSIAAGLMVSRGQLLVARGHRFPTSRVDALLQHEVGTHIVTYYNGTAQRFRQLSTGLAGYDELQEGLAVLAEYLAGGLSPERLRILAARVLGVRALIDGASFVDVFRFLCRCGFAQRVSFNVALRIFRGGGLTKDMVYLRGLGMLLDYLQSGKELSPLYVGKMGFAHVPIVSELLSREVLRPPRLMPRFLARPEAQRRLEELKVGVKLHELAD